MVRSRSSERKPPRGKAGAAKAPAPGRAKSRERSAPEQQPRLAAIYRVLQAIHPDAKCALNHRNAFELLVATILSAQCTDERVNQVTPVLFGRFPDPASLAAADPSEVEDIVRSTGFFRNKAKAIQGAARMIVQQFGGQVPGTMEELVRLPGVARKTANVVLGNAFGRNDGVVVDTHVQRLSQRLGLSRQSDPARIEQDLMAQFPREDWTMLAHLLIFHGRRVCSARKPRCSECLVHESCLRVGVSPAGQ